jgi:hypothetical protein
MGQIDMKYTMDAYNLRWENGRVFIPPKIECKMYRNKDGTALMADECSGFWIYDSKLKPANVTALMDNREGIWEASVWEEEDGWHVAAAYYEYYEGTKEYDDHLKAGGTDEDFIVPMHLIYRPEWPEPQTETPLSD